MSFRPGSVDYDGVMADHYNAGRPISETSRGIWGDLVSPHVVGRDRILDLGAGTGRFSVPLADWSGGLVIGVEPAEGMRSVAAGIRDDRVRFIAGRAEELPLAGGSVGAALLSNVIHHVVDRAACARELFRVLRPGSAVMLRGAFGDRLDGITLFDYFPEARSVCEGFPTASEVRAAFTTAGFEVEKSRRVEQETCVGLAALAKLTALRADSTLASIPDEVFEARQAGLERAAAAEVEPRPVRDRLDFLVARKP